MAVLPHHCIVSQPRRPRLDRSPFLFEIVREIVDWIHLAYIGTSLGSCEDGSKPSGTVNDGEFPQ
jgi:hypothetical protein